MNAMASPLRRMLSVSGLSLFSLGACRAVLGVDSESREVQCVRDSDCTGVGSCVEFQCKFGRGGGSTGGSNASSSEHGSGAPAVDDTLFAHGGTIAVANDSSSAPTGGTVATSPATASGHGGTSEPLSSSASPAQAGSSTSGGSLGSGSGAAGIPSGGSAGTVVSAGSAGVSGQPVTEVCVANQHRCWSYEQSFDVYSQTCESNLWKDDAQPCANFCSNENGCQEAPSCEGFLSNCLTNVSCCNAKWVPGGKFIRSQILNTSYCTTNSPCPAELSAFSLDTFEVTVARFRNFVNDYPDSIPAPGAGRNPRNAADQGWLAEWRSLLPVGPSELRQDLTPPACVGSTYTDVDPTNDFVAMNCVSWYLAYAFCAWDGGRLPTEAEWNFAAAGGTENRYYPWSSPSGSSVVQPGRAIYLADPLNPPAGPAVVGSASAGMARWGHFDLAGNVAEWVLDAWAAPYAETTQCDNCANMSWASEPRRVIRGGGYWSEALGIRVSSRTNELATRGNDGVGLRCARDL